MGLRYCSGHVDHPFAADIDLWIRLPRVISPADGVFLEGEHEISQFYRTWNCV
jgi:murein endopeptidase